MKLSRLAIAPLLFNAGTQARAAYSTKDLKTSSGAPIPMIGLGTWQSDPEKVTDAVYSAIKAGYRHIDCAAEYGNEVEVGRGINRAIDDGVVKREDLWITSKLWNDRHRKGLVQGGLEGTLRRLNTSYLDLYLIHWPVSFVPSHDVAAEETHRPIKENIKDELKKRVTSGPKIDHDTPVTTTYSAMEDLVDKGLTRYIGVSNFSPDEIRRVLDTSKIRPAVHQFEAHPYLPQTEFIRKHVEWGVVVTAYSPLGNTNPKYHDRSKGMPLLLEHPTIQEIAKKTGCTPAQVVLKWGIMRDTIIIPKTINDTRVEENLGALECDMTNQEVEEIDRISEEHLKRFNNPAKGWGVKCFEGLQDSG